eukprot:6488301-Amphidinium_carterae.1
MMRVEPQMDTCARMNTQWQSRGNTSVAPCNKLLKTKDCTLRQKSTFDPSAASLDLLNTPAH